MLNTITRISLEAAILPVPCRLMRRRVTASNQALRRHRLSTGRGTRANETDRARASAEYIRRSGGYHHPHYHHAQ